MRLFAFLAAALLLAAISRQRQAPHRRRRGEFLWRCGAADRRARGACHQHPDQSESGPSYLRSQSLDGARDRRCRPRRLQRRRLRPLGCESARRLPGPGPQGHRRRRSGAAEIGRQSPSLVRSGDHAGARQGAGRRIRRPRSRPSADYESRLQAFLASLEPMNRKIAELRQKYAGQPVTRDRAGLRLYVRCLGPRHAQSAVPDCGHERYRAQRQPDRRLREGSEDPRGQGAVLQQPGDRRSDGAAAEDRHRSPACRSWA